MPGDGPGVFRPTNRRSAEFVALTVPFNRFDLDSQFHRADRRETLVKPPCAAPLGEQGPACNLPGGSDEAANGKPAPMRPAGVWFDGHGGFNPSFRCRAKQLPTGGGGTEAQFAFSPGRSPLLIRTQANQSQRDEDREGSVDQWKTSKHERSVQKRSPKSTFCAEQVLAHNQMAATPGPVRDRK